MSNYHSKLGTVHSTTTTTTNDDYYYYNCSPRRPEAKNIRG